MSSHRRLRLLLSLAALTSALAVAQTAYTQSAQALNQRHFNYRDATYVTLVPNEPPATPTWDPGSGEPPLSPARALSATEPEFQKTFGSTGGFRLQGIHLTRQGSGWMYQIIYLQTIEDAKAAMAAARSGGGFGQSLLPVIYYVTLDGAVHGPKFQP